MTTDDNGLTRPLFKCARYRIGIGNKRSLFCREHFQIHILEYNFLYNFFLFVPNDLIDNK